MMTAQPFAQVHGSVDFGLQGSLPASMRTTPTFGKSQSVGSAPALGGNSSSVAPSMPPNPQTGYSTSSSAPAASTTTKNKSPEKPSTKQPLSQGKPPLHAPRGSQPQTSTNSQSTPSASNIGSDLEYGFIPKRVLASLNDKSDYKVRFPLLIDWRSTRPYSFIANLSTRSLKPLYPSL